MTFKLKMQAKIRKRMLLGCSFIGIISPISAYGQSKPNVISPVKVDSDINDVNLTDGKVRFKVPSLSVPAAPRLAFDLVQNAMPYLVAKVSGGSGDYINSSVSVHYGTTESEFFRCRYDDVCQSQKLSGAVIDGDIVNGSQYTVIQANTGATYTFDRSSYNDVNARNPGTAILYASSVAYPDGEIISYSYDTAQYPGDNRTYYRVNNISSNLGYHIIVSYQTNDFPSNFWGNLSQATLYNSGSPSTPLGQLNYSASGAIADLGGRVYQCAGCQNSTTAPVELISFSMSLPSESGTSLTVTADSNSRVVSNITRDGVSWSYNFANVRQMAGSLDYAFDQVSVSGPAGYQKTYVMANGSAERPNLVSSITDALGRKTSYQYDGFYRPTVVTYPEGDSAQINYDTSGNITSKVSTPKPGSNLSKVTESATYDTSNCLVRGVLCFRPTSFTDALGRRTDYSYDSAGRLTQRTDPADASGVRRVTYLSYGNSFTAPTVVRICGLGTTCGTGAESRTEYTYVGATSLPATETRIDGANGISLTTTYSYDTAGRLLVQDGPLPGTDDAVYNRYDVLGRKTWEIGPRNSANGVRQAKRFSYRDSDDKVVSIELGYVTDPNSGTLNVLNRMDTSYDSRRNPIREVLLSGGTTFAVMDASYDDRGQKICSTTRMNPATFGSLPGDACSLGTEGTVGPDRIVKNTYDAAGQLLQVRRGMGTPLEQAYATYAYSPNGKQTDVIDANGNRAQMSYDGFDRLAKWSFPVTGAPTGYAPSTPANAFATAGAVSSSDYESYGYDAVGNRTSWRRRDGQVINYGYDGLNRMVSKDRPNNSYSEYDQSYDYDVFGHLTSASDTSGRTLKYDYDALGNRRAQYDNVYTFGNATFQYDAAGRRTKMTWGDGSGVTYDYLATGKMSTIRDGVGNVLVSFGYDNLGRRTSLSRANGTVTSYVYDPASRLSQLTQDLAGSANDLTVTFNFNSASQITSRNASNEGYAWTAGVNADRSYGVNGLNQYTQAGSVSLGYDGRGNLTSSGSDTYSYTVDNQMAVGKGVGMAYDPLGRLFNAAVDPGTNTSFTYDGPDLIAETDQNNGALLRRYVYGQGSDEPLIWYEGTGFGDRRWLHADERGSIVAVTNDAGNAIAINRYDEYGIPQSGNVGRFQYTGQKWLPALGLYDYKARIYSPTLGRFMQTDPIGYDDQINLYSYTGNDPVNLVDRDGRRTATPGEAILLHFAFGGALDSQADNPLLIMNAPWTTSILSQGRPFNGPMGSINFSSSTYKGDFSKVPIQDRTIFYHEFWHRFEITIGKASIEGLLANQVMGGFGNSIYTPKNKTSFWDQNPEARADIFANAMVTGNFKALNGVSGRINSTTTFSFNSNGMSVKEQVTGSFIPRITQYKGKPEENSQ